MNLTQLLDLTIERRASDLHLVVGYQPTLRIFSELIPIVGHPVLTDEDMQQFIEAVLTPLQKQTFLNSWEIDIAIEHRSQVRFRVNVYREEGHISSSLRLIPRIIPEIETLGLPKTVLKLVELKQGLVLVTGPTGHGKSTTLASMINRINNTKAVKILTIEDPIEYIYPKAKSLVTQREMLTDTKSWNSSLRSALREDPDVVLVGEMRDYETIAATITIAETGHLVLATLHTNSASQSIDRIIDAFPAYQQSQIRTQLAATLEAIISQRLIPTVTPGRALGVEVLIKTPAVSSIVRDAKTHLLDNLIQTSAELGMISFESSLAKLVQEGKISYENAYNFAIRPEILAKLLDK